LVDPGIKVEVMMKRLVRGFEIRRIGIGCRLAEPG
jgi:hypothetical protein